MLNTFIREKNRRRWTVDGERWQRAGGVAGARGRYTARVIFKCLVIITAGCWNFSFLLSFLPPHLRQCCQKDGWPGGVKVESTSDKYSEVPWGGTTIIASYTNKILNKFQK